MIVLISPHRSGTVKGKRTGISGTDSGDADPISVCQAFRDVLDIFLLPHVELLGIPAPCFALRLQIFEYDHICLMVFCKSDDLTGYFDRKIIVDPFSIVP